MDFYKKSSTKKVKKYRNGWGKNMYDAIIIGAGPAGLTSALYLLRANKKVLILEAKSYGGQIVNAGKIENYPAIESISGFDFATNLYKQVMKLNGKVQYETVLQIKEDKTVVTEKAEYQGKTVIIATGAHPRKLNLENEKSWIGRGISYCATCDGNFYKNKIVAVVGGGNTAVFDALYLSTIASKVYLIHRRDEWKSYEKYIEEVKSTRNIEMIVNATIVALNGEEQLQSITIKNKEEEKEIAVDGLFIAIGQEPQNERFKNVVDLDSFGYIETTKDVYTKTKGIYAAGDARVKTLRQLTTAVSDGSIAAIEAIKEMKE